jgi:hypothetical protein
MGSVIKYWVVFLGEPLLRRVYCPLHPQLMLWFTYYKGTFSTFVFASQNRSFMLRSVLRTLRPSIHLTQNPVLSVKKIALPDELLNGLGC